MGRVQQCKTQRERGPVEAKCPSQTKQEGAGGRGTMSEGEARSSDMLSEKTVRISEVDCDGHGRSLLRKGGQTSAANEAAPSENLRRLGARKL